MKRVILRLIRLVLVFLIWPGMLQARSVEGKLFDTSGAIAEADLIFVRVETEESLVVETDAKGEFALQLEAGEYDVYQRDTAGRKLLGRVQIGKEGNRDLELRAPSDREQSLSAIRNYELSWVQAETTVEDQSLSDLINPFPAKKQGRFHGSLYEFHRNDNLDARNFFDPVGEPLPEYKRNQFGGTLGVIVSPKFSLQGSYDGLRIVQGSTILSHIPQKKMKLGDFSDLAEDLLDPLTGNPFPSNRIPDARINSVSKRLLAVVPDPNRSDPDRNFVNNDPRIRNQDRINLRADYETKDNSTWVGEYIYTGVDQGIVRPVPNFSSRRDERHQELSLSYNRPLSERLVGFARVEVGRNRTFSLSRNAGTEGLLDSLGIAGLQVEDPLEEGYPSFDLSGYADFGDRDSPSTRIRNRANLEASFTYVLNDHTLRGGLSYSVAQLNNYRSDGLHRGSFSFSGAHTGDAFGDFLLGLPDTAFRGVGSDRVDLRQWKWEGFFRDQWKILPSLEFTYGINYHFSQPYHSANDNVSGFYPLLFEPPLNGAIVVRGSDEAKRFGLDQLVDGSLVFPDNNDFAPRLGLAVNPLGSNRLVIRGTYSVWYDAPDDWAFVRSLSRNYPFYFVESVESSEGSPPFFLDNPFETASIPELTVRGVEPYLRSAYIQSWSLDLENEISRNWTLGITYGGRKGTNMMRLIPGNIPLPGPGPIQERRPNPEFGKFSIVNDGGSYSGHSLDLAAERRLSKGLSLRSGFEWNRYVDDSVWSDPQNPRNLRAEKAAAAWIPRKRIFLSYIIDLPLSSVPPFRESADWLHWALDGWRLSGITEIQDGRPFTVTTPGDPNNDGAYGDRPSRLGSGVLDSSERSVNQWFDTSAFVEADPAGFGTAGRNILLGPGYQAWDISVIKQTRFADGDVLELRVEFFNAFNEVNFERPDSQFGNSTFGKIFGAERSREIEVALKYLF